MDNFTLKTFLGELKRSRERVLSGGINCIPFSEGLPAFSKVLPGVVKGLMYSITGSSNSGKSQLTKFLFIFTLMNYIRKHPEQSIKLRIIYFALEENEMEFWASVASYELYRQFNIRISPNELKSLDKTFSKEIWDKLQLVSPEIEWIMSHIDLVTSINKPTGMFKYCENIALKLGESKDKTIEITGGRKVEIFSHYIPHDPDKTVLVITDHINLINGEHRQDMGFLTKHQAMAAWSTDYCTGILTKRWNWAVVNVHQQALDGEKQQFDYKGKSIISKLLPSMDSLGGNKEIVRDLDCLIGLFNPSKFEIEEHDGYDITQMRDNYRQLCIIKNRQGRRDVTKSLFFDGSCNSFFELPKDPLQKSSIYDRCKAIQAIT